MNKQELEILSYLEHAYSCARLMDDISAIIRISRAIAAFKSNPEDAPEAIFTDSFLESYYMKG